MRFLRTCCLGVIMLTAVGWSYGQVLTGKVTDGEGNPLSYATIWIEELQLGTATNLDGLYQTQMGLGTYTMVTKYLGYQPHVQTITIGTGTQTIDVQLKEEVFSLEQIEVSGDMEDPAFTIMRRAIAKADFHRNQVDGYSVEVYLKGSGRLRGVPRLFRKRILRALEEEGIDTATAFVSESVSEVKYTRPNQYEEVVKSIYTYGNDYETSPNSFIQASFYEPELANAISPLSPKAFAYYQFEYQGFFTEGDHTINKIKVTPRSKGDHVFEGMLYIVDQDWSIHSLDFETSLLGIRFGLKHIYQEIEPYVWMPINQVYNVNGKVFGFSFTGQYLANFGEYNIQLNPDLEYTFDVIDAKLERDKAAELDRKAKKEKMAENPLLGISTQEELTPKTLRKMMRNYEKEERDSRPDSMLNIVAISSQTIDSLAYQRDSAYWESIRPLPLSDFEVKGYEVLAAVDSSDATHHEEEVSEDSITMTLGSEGSSLEIDRKSRFKIHHLLTGSRYKVADGKYLRLHGPLTHTHVNTVEGFNSEIGLTFQNRTSEGVEWLASGFLHYGFSNELLLGHGTINIGSRGNKNAWDIDIYAGSDIQQINEEKPIAELFNDVTTLFLEQNFMKVLRRDEYSARLEKRLSDRWRFHTKVSWEEKRLLENAWDGRLINWKKRTYTSNVPFNQEIVDTRFSDYQLFRWDFGLRAKPWLKYRIENGKRRRIDSSTPEIMLNVRGGIAIDDENAPNYWRTEIGLNHSWNIGVRGTLSLNLEAGKYWGSEAIPFPEYKHFAANLTPFVGIDPTQTFRLLDYYRYSTSDQYLTLHTHFQFRKFALTRFDIMRRKGIREALFINALETPTSNHYAELGYSINYLFRFFRVEFVTSWQDFKYQSWGVRLGIASNLEDIFGF